MLIFLFLYVFLNLAFAATYPVALGDREVLIKVIEGRGDKAFVHLHQNETTALKAAREVAKARGLGLLTLEHQGGRNISFNLNHQRYEFDPNRIFSDEGIKSSLNTYSHYTPEAHALVKKLAESIVEHLPRGRVIAVHNNQGYSMKYYLKGQPLEKDAKSIYMTKKQYFRNFYFVTQSKDFYRLKKLGLNTVLQADHPKDDGSLSLRLAKQDYLNVEAGYQHLNAQIQMLKKA